MALLDEVWLDIFAKLPYHHYTKIAQSCKQFNRIIANEYLWQKLSLYHHISIEEPYLLNCEKELHNKWLLDYNDKPMKLPIFVSPRDSMDFKLFRHSTHYLTLNKPNLRFKKNSKYSNHPCDMVWVGICKNNKPEFPKKDLANLWMVLIHDDLIIVTDIHNLLDNSNIYFQLVYHNGFQKKQIRLYLKGRLIYTTLINDDEEWYPIVGVQDGDYEKVLLIT